ncbi:hypothetical protein GCM10007939_22340 [Amylibacter marinus]|uniref:Uncharacterized protein n=1 Tax=Amylibacter marinus TaxID=1475483 RepID=A0ABQ5VXG6_9RHOB|nr:hypothetical protein GCM10007939_22340 [Amylibacter marinus]
MWSAIQRENFEAENGEIRAYNFYATGWGAGILFGLVSRHPNHRANLGLWGIDQPLWWHGPN